ncbi:unnamed protein product [Miscanthus lutarioriparius]|uniref:Uncharacterized protein n=1 Tax=Miscanthus lutarioriparius TaxID=422564 RepID=A0A811QL34_9POAL|nr:unnamed protein product [Miscanthus lutarioriparius]
MPLVLVFIPNIKKFTVEEYSFLLRIIYSKLGQNKELADLLTQEYINLSSSSDEIDKDPMMARIEAKVDLLNKKVTEGNAEILKCVQVSNKGEWGTIEVFGKKL